MNNLDLVSDNSLCIDCDGALTSLNRGPNASLRTVGKSVKITFCKSFPQIFLKLFVP